MKPFQAYLKGTLDGTKSINMRDFTSALTTLDILDVAHMHPVLRRYHEGTFPLDALPKLTITGKRPRHIVYNTSPSNQLGTHWVSIWLSADMTGEVMNSLGNRPLQPEVLTFLQRNASRIVYSVKPIQNGASNACGLYCLSHGLARARGKTLATWLSQFTDCDDENDQKMYCEFMREMALPALFTPRMHNWKQAIARACRKVVCSKASRTPDARKAAWKSSKQRRSK